MGEHDFLSRTGCVSILGVLLAFIRVLAAITLAVPGHVEGPVQIIALPFQDAQMMPWSRARLGNYATLGLRCGDTG